MIHKGETTSGVIRDLPRVQLSRPALRCSFGARGAAGLDLSHWQPRLSGQSLAAIHGLAPELVDSLLQCHQILQRTSTCRAAIVTMAQHFVRSLSRQQQINGQS